MLLHRLMRRAFRKKDEDSVNFSVVSDVCYDQGYGSNLDFLTEPSYGIGTEPSYESTKNEDSPISYGNSNNFLSYGQPQEGKL